MTNSAIQENETHEYRPTLSGMAVQLAQIQEMINGVLENNQRSVITTPPPKREMTEKDFLDLIAEKLLYLQMDLDTIQERIKPLI